LHVEEDRLMELLTLNAQYQPAKAIENWDSLLWVERFNTISDFKLETGMVSEYMSILPEGTVLTLRESNVPMIVETHQIERKKNTPQKLIITGRSFTSILDRRAAIQSVAALTGSANWNVNVKTPSDLAYYIINKICVEGQVSAADIFPAAQVQFPTPADYLTSTGPTKSFSVDRGNLLEIVLKLLQTEAAADPTTTPATPAIAQHGIRAVRPNQNGTAIAIEIYTGVDRRSTVYFDVTRDLLDDGNYLFSKVGSKNAAYGVAAGLAATMYEGAVEPTGLNRRVVLVDASTSGIADPTILKNAMSQSLAEASETAMFDGSINQELSPYIYGVDYGLGDIVRTVGDYGLDQASRVTEFIRSEDKSGRKAYPTLQALTV
ncbi:MAG TPA: hypothetical protein VFT30_00790, partial [Nitrospira sp.]|nr:hypothetical protein [Nitrospira sp.]